MEPNGPYCMGYYNREDIPFQFALAEAFTICDTYHCSVMGPTWPNRMYWMTGTIDPDGLHGGPILNKRRPGRIYLDYISRAAGGSRRQLEGISAKGQLRLQHAGDFQDLPRSRQWLAAAYESNGARPEGQFEYDARHDRLPAVSWIIPTSYQSEHPDYMPADGAAFVASKIDAIAANPDVWAKTAFILNYDENDGIFDHVAPPVPRRARLASL